MKCNQPHPGFELVSPCPFPTTITITPRASISMQTKPSTYSFNQKGGIFTLKDGPLKLVDKFIYLGSSISSTENDINMRLAKAWTAINRLSVIWKSNLANEIKRGFFFQAAVMLILLYGCTTWTLTKYIEKKLDGNYTRMLQAILNKSWRQHLIKKQL